MVSLAKQLEGQPFHMIASYCQREDKQRASRMLKQNGWNQKMKNITVAGFADFKRGVQKGNYVPYYMIFDHKGKLIHHHQAGPYHGGNGNKYQQQVKALVKKAKKK